MTLLPRIDETSYEEVRRLAMFPICRSVPVYCICGMPEIISQPIYGQMHQMQRKVSFCMSESYTDSLKKNADWYCTHCTTG